MKGNYHHYKIIIVFFALFMHSSCLYNHFFVTCKQTGPYWHQTYKDRLKYRTESADIKYYYDKKYDVNIFYPSSFHIADTSKVGKAHFDYSDIEFQVSLKLTVDSNILNRDVEKEVVYMIDKSDPTVTCLEKGKDYYLVIGNSFYKKCFLIDNNWIGYTLSYTKDCEGAIDRLVDLIKEWDPRVKPYENNGTQ